MDKNKRKKSVKDMLKGIDDAHKEYRKPESITKIANQLEKASKVRTGKALSDKDINKFIQRIKKAIYGGKPHLKHGGKAKKKYGVVGKPKLRKGGKV